MNEPAPVEYRVPPPTWSDPVVVAAHIVELSNVALEQLRFWICPCCGMCRVVYAQDTKGRVWLSQTLSMYPDGRVFRLDEIEEVDEIFDVLRMGDLNLMRAWYATGLRTELLQLMVN